jgi:hypothetical protein
MGEPHRAGAPRLEQAGEARIGVDLQDAAEVGEMRRWPLAPAVRGVE